MKKLLVTGAAGFIGTNFVNYWRERKPKDIIVALDSLTYAGNAINLEHLRHDPTFAFIEGDIRDQQLVTDLLKNYQIDTIVHFAAESHVDRSITGPDTFLETNITGTHSLLKAAKKIWLDSNDRLDNHHFHHVSTDEVYGSLTDDGTPFCETTPYAPNSPYAASKAASDHLVRAYNQTFGLKTTTSNCSNNYGPFQFPEKLLPLCILNILLGKSIPVYGDGQQIRDWLFVDDHNTAIDLVLSSGRHSETYNIGGNNEMRNLDVVKLLCSLLDSQFDSDETLKQRYPHSPCAQNNSAASLISFVQDRPGHDVRYAVDASKIKSTLKFVPSETFATGLKKTIDWYINNQSWWENIKNGSYRKKRSDM